MCFDHVPGIAYAFFKIQNKLMKGGIRPTREIELAGFDLPEMGVLRVTTTAISPASSMNTRLKLNHVDEPACC